MKKLLFMSTALLLMTLTQATETKSKPVYITSGLLSLEVTNPITGIKHVIQRVQDRTARIDKSYSKITRGKINAMNPFKPYNVETIGELEVIDYMKSVSNGENNIIIIDTRKPSWYRVNGHIPLSINIQAKHFKNEEFVIEKMEEVFGVLVDGKLLDFSYAKTLVIYCNGVWCGKTPSVIRKLLSYGYPAIKIKYYRGGMQSWRGLGLSVVNIFNTPKK